MAGIPDQIVAEVRERADIVQIVGRHVSLKKSGGRLWGLCPFHSEKTPSFSVQPDKQVFYCFGCAVGGDVFAFRMRQDGVGFPDVVRALAAELGVVIRDTSGVSSGKRERLFRANDAALECFRSALRSAEGAPARRYLERRGVPADLIERFQLGFAPPRWDGLIEQLQRRGEPLETAEEAGLIARRRTGDGHYDRFRGRLIFPITEPGGRVLGFGGRALEPDDQPKYLNSPETPLYRKSRALFGLSLAIDAIRERGRAIVVEGYFDLLALHRAGLPEGVAPCGTALTTEHARCLRRYTREVVLLFDGDDAGRRAAERSLQPLSSQGLRVRAAFLPADQDPDTLLEQSGEAALRSCVENAVPLLDHLIDARLGLARLPAWKAADAVRELAPFLSSISDPIERDATIRTLALRLELPPGEVQAVVRESGAKASPAADSEPEAVERERVDDPVVQALIGALASYPDLLSVLDDLPAGWLPEGAAGLLLETLGKASQQHGTDAVSRLISPDSGELPPALKAELSRIVAESDPGAHREAERAARDCVSRIRLRRLDLESRSLTLRLESCTDPQEQRALLEAKQRNMAERNELWGHIREV